MKSRLPDLKSGQKKPEHGEEAALSPVGDQGGIAIELEYFPSHWLLWSLEWLVILVIAIGWLVSLGALGFAGLWELTERWHGYAPPLRGAWVFLPLAALGLVFFFWSAVGAYRIHQRTVTRLRYSPGRLEFQLRDWNTWFTRSIAEIAKLHSHPPERRHMGHHYLRFKDGDWIGLHPQSTHLADVIAAIDRERGRVPV